MGSVQYIVVDHKRKRKKKSPHQLNDLPNTADKCQTELYFTLLQRPKRGVNIQASMADIFIIFSPYFS